MKIGIMSFAHQHAYSYANSLMNLEGVELVGIFEEDLVLGKELAEKYNTVHFSTQDTFLEINMDAVIVCSENIYHKEMVINAANAKKHILCEKPIATNKEDALEMIRVCEENEVILQIAFPVRFCSPIVELKRILDQGMLGEVVAFRTTNRGTNPGGWFVQNELSGGGATLDHTVHMIDIMRWFLEKEITDVYSEIDSCFGELESDDAGILTMKFENGVIASHDASWSRFENYPTWGDVSIEVIGTKETVKVSVTNEHLKVYMNKNKALNYAFTGNDMDYELVKYFISCVQEGREPSITGKDGLKALEVALAAYESNLIGEKVKL